MLPRDLTDTFAFSRRAGFTATSHVLEGPGDRNGHGTHVAGIAAGKTFGAAKSASLIAVKVLGRDGSGTTADIIEGKHIVFLKTGSFKSRC